MIAKNIAPGLKREFAFEKRDWYPKEHIKNEREKAESEVMLDKQHTIIASDIDPVVIQIAKENAQNAGVSDYIQFSEKDMTAHVGELRAPSCFISNPPYGERMNPDNLQAIYKTFDALFSQEVVYGGIITPQESRVSNEELRTTKTFFNGADKVTFRKKNK